MLKNMWKDQVLKSDLKAPIFIKVNPVANSLERGRKKNHRILHAKMTQIQANMQSRQKYEQ